MFHQCINLALQYILDVPALIHSILSTWQAKMHKHIEIFLIIITTTIIACAKKFILKGRPKTASDNKNNWDIFPVSESIQCGGHFY
jgi:hypothetical protein